MALSPHILWTCSLTVAAAYLCLSSPQVSQVPLSFFRCSQVLPLRPLCALYSHFFRPLTEKLHCRPLLDSQSRITWWKHGHEGRLRGLSVPFGSEPLTPLQWPLEIVPKCPLDVHFGISAEQAGIFHIIFFMKTFNFEVFSHTDTADTRNPPKRDTISTRKQCHIFHIFTFSPTE